MDVIDPVYLPISVPFQVREESNIYFTFYCRKINVLSMYCTWSSQLTNLNVLGDVHQQFSLHPCGVGLNEVKLLT